MVWTGLGYGLDVLRNGVVWFWWVQMLASGYKFICIWVQVYIRLGANLHEFGYRFTSIWVQIYMHVGVNLPGFPNCVFFLNQGKLGIP